MRMRSFHIAAATGVLAFGLLFSQQPATAAGNVLLPSDSDSSGTLPSFGFEPVKPKTSPAPSGESGTPQNQPGDQSDNSILPETGSNNQNSSAAPRTGGYTPIPAPVAAPQFTMPTHVIKMPAPQAISYPAQTGLPNSLTFKIADKYVWGP